MILPAMFAFEFLRNPSFFFLLHLLLSPPFFAWPLSAEVICLPVLDVLAAPARLL